MHNSTFIQGVNFSMDVKNLTWHKNLINNRLKVKMLQRNITFMVSVYGPAANLKTTFTP